MKSENIKKGFASNNNRRSRKKEAAKNTAEITSAASWRQKTMTTMRRGTRTRSENAKWNRKRRKMCHGMGLHVNVCAYKRCHSLCVWEWVCASAWHGLKFFKLVSMRNETKNQQFLFWWFFQHYARRSFPGLKHLMVILDWTTAKTAQDATNCFRRSAPTPPAPNKKKCFHLQELLAVKRLIVFSACK